MILVHKTINLSPDKKLFDLPLVLSFTSLICVVSKAIIYTISVHFR